AAPLVGTLERTLAADLQDRETSRRHARDPRRRCARRDPDRRQVRGLDGDPVDAARPLAEGAEVEARRGAAHARASPRDLVAAGAAARDLVAEEDAQELLVLARPLGRGGALRDEMELDHERVAREDGREVLDEPHDEAVEDDAERVRVPGQLEPQTLIGSDRDV